MQPQPCSRIDLGDLRAQIAKKIGSERSKRYFFYLGKYLSQKLSKSEFNKVCYRVLGKENLPIHNQLIRSVLKNVCQAKTSPHVHEADAAIQPTKCLSSRDDLHEHMPAAPNQNRSMPIWSNGVLPSSPLKGRDWKLRDRPNGKVECVSHQSTGAEDFGSKIIMENGESALCDYQRPVQSLQEIEINGSVERPTVHSKYQNEVDVVKDQEVVERENCLHYPLRAPLGIPFCSASAGGACKPFPVVSCSDHVSSCNNGGLPDTETLRKHMEQVAAAQGLGGVSMEGANVLNGMLDVYLKQLIRSCMLLVGAHEPRKHHEQSQNTVAVDGTWSSNHFRTQSSSGSMEDQRPRHAVSLLDFKVAMVLNPQQLGEDWPLLLHKISSRNETLT